MEKIIFLLFREMYDRERARGNKQGVLCELGEIVGGGTPSKVHPEYYLEDRIPWITPKDLSILKKKFLKRGSVNISRLGLDKSSAKLLPRGSVLFSSRAPIGYIVISQGELCTNQGFKYMIPKSEMLKEYIYCFLNENISLIESLASGSTFKEISASAMRKIPVILPEENDIVIFKNNVAPLFEMQENIEKENDLLKKLRDKFISYHFC